LLGPFFAQGVFCQTVKQGNKEFPEGLDRPGQDVALAGGRKTQRNQNGKDNPCHQDNFKIYGDAVPPEGYDQLVKLTQFLHKAVSPDLYERRA
jgi:hypothetical protein